MGIGTGHEQALQITSGPGLSVPENRSVDIGIVVFESGKNIEYGNELRDCTNLDEDGHIRRTGTLWTASAHVITAVIGSGVLSLAWSMSQLGWVAGPIVLAAFALITYCMSLLLADSYRSLDGQRNYTYMDAVRSNLGGMQIWLCGLVQYSNLVGVAIGYTITASTSMVAIRRSNCFYLHGENAQCNVSNNMYMLMFGLIQIILSQIPDFGKIWWLSIVAAIMSFSYSLIGLGLGIGKVSEKVSLGRTESAVRSSYVGSARKTWTAFQALGNVAFAYSFATVLIEIQDTLKSSPPENKTMKKATLISIGVTTLFYMSVAFVGFSAFGDNSPGNLLTGFGFYNPFWLIDVANACIVIHLVGAYQVFSQPVFAFVESWAITKWSRNSFLHRERQIPIPLGTPFKFSIFRLIWRIIFVVFTTLVSMIIPFFNDLLGLIGALSFWPLTVYFPISMYVCRSQVKRESFKWVALQSVSAACFLVSLMAGLGSIMGVIRDLSHYTPFKTS